MRNAKNTNHHCTKRLRTVAGKQSFVITKELKNFINFHLIYSVLFSQFFFSLCFLCCVRFVLFHFIHFAILFRIFLRHVFVLAMLLCCVIFFFSYCTFLVKDPTLSSMRTHLCAINNLLALINIHKFCWLLNANLILLWSVVDSLQTP